MRYFAAIAAIVAVVATGTAIRQHEASARLEDSLRADLAAARAELEADAP